MRYRLANVSDLQNCVPLLPKAFRPSARVRARLTELWQRLIEINPANIVVFEDENGLEGCAISAHVGEPFVHEALAKPAPHLAARFYEEMLGGRSPVLTPAELRKANSSGNLHLLVLHFGLRNHDLSDERTRAVLRMGAQAFYFFNLGYRYAFFLNEVYGRQAADYMRGGGFRLLNEFETDGCALAERSFLFGLRGDWVASGAINTMGFLFDPAAPRFGFTPAEQRVLLRAMLNESDAQIAEHLGVSLEAVKKTWRRAFDRAMLAAPSLFGARDSHGDAEGRQSRGFEKRRHLLDYLRVHLAELRPY
ncbi:MAG TPA: hypothetical protein VFV10_09395 [Gammaproteobacteria bacterium]|nr:hypothetical protein [Gammaproteobacteria bacterium]